MGACVAGAHDAGTALSPSGDSCALVCANLVLAAAGLGLGTTRGISLGRVTTGRDRRGREDCVQHLAFHPPSRLPAQRRKRCPLPGWHGDGYHDPSHPGPIPDQSRSVYRPGSRRGIPRGCGPVAPLSGQCDCKLPGNRNVRVRESQCRKSLEKSVLFPAERNVFEPEFLHLRWRIEIAPIHDELARHHFAGALPVQLLVIVPLGADQRGM
jgi:hypothetical protein